MKSMMFMVSLEYTASLRLAWAIAREPISKTEAKQKR